VTTYPDGYATRLITLDAMRAKYEPKMHPEFARRLFPWVESMGGLIGIGNGWRDKQPDKPGFAPDGKSFHQSQTWASGLVAYAAVDLVARAAFGNPNPAHRSPTWAESKTAPAYGLHTFVTGEPWHMQCIETRGWQSWVNAGRPDPKHFTLPGTIPPPPPQPTTQENDMVRIDLDPNTDRWTSMVIGATTITHIVNGHHAAVLARADVAQENVTKTELLGILMSLRATNASPFAPGKPAADPALHAVWEAAKLKAA